MKQSCRIPRKKWLTKKNLDKLSISFYCESISNSVSLFHTQFVLHLLFFFKQFQSQRFHKVFSYTKIKVYYQFKPQRRKTRWNNYRLKYHDFWFLGKNISCVIYPWDNVLEGQFSSGKLCRQQIIRKTIFLGGSFQGDIVREQLSLKILSGSNHPGDNCPGGNYPRTIFLGGNYPRRQLSRGQ